MMENFTEDCLPWEGFHDGAGKSGRTSYVEEEGTAETTRDELTATPIPHPPVPPAGSRERNRE